MTDSNDFTIKGVEVDQQPEPVFEQFAGEEEAPDLVIVEPVQPDVPVTPLPEVIKGDQPAPEREFTLPKPGFGIPYGKYYSTGRGGVNHGPAVEYMNRKFGLSGDRFTSETHNAVVAWQKKNRFFGSGKVDFEQYARM